VLVLRFLHELSHAEIARQLGKREDAVRALQYRALRELRRRYGLSA
jgi:DNA-directed RNA polymerase specialized sigma24 family protein